MIARASHKRYAHAKQFQLYKNGESEGILCINEKDSEEEKRQLRKMVEKYGVDKIVLIWTAREGNVNEEVII